MPDVELSAASIGDTGSGQAFDSHQPSLGMTWIIALHGVYPSRS